jgi:peptidoglycan/xylan/chitin deacetylase (PgdA/CDA1 family)
MAARRASPRRKRKQTGGGSGGCLLYLVVMVLGTASGVQYHFREVAPQSAARSAAPPAVVASPAVAASPAATASQSRPVRAPREERREAEEPAVTVRSVEPSRDRSAVSVAPVPSAPTAVGEAVEPLPPTEIERGAGVRPEVALTFDAGADWKPVKRILEALAARNLKATFFLTGEWVEKNPKTSRLIAEQGHEIGNHSWDHPPFTRLGDEAIRDQLRRTEGAIRAVTGRSSRPYFRPPLGDRDPRVRSIVGEEGYLTVYWTLDSRDSVDRGITADQIRRRVLDKVAAGSIVLLHCGSQPTADALAPILDGLEARGLRQVTLSRLLEE